MKGKTNLLRILALLLALVLLAIPLSTAMADPSQAPAPSGVSANEKKVPSPSVFLGFEVGSDYNLADWTQELDYFAALDKASPRVKVEVIGETTGTENFDPEQPFGPQPMIVAIISDEENIAQIDKYKAIQQKLANPDTMSAEEADKLMAEAKPVVAIGAAQHASEVAGTQMALNLAYKLASGNDDEVNEILHNTILLLVPSVNPDGMQMEVNWYRKYLKEHPNWAGRGVPWLYQKYVGHDDNRDWYMFSQKEIANMGRLLYQEWFPEMTYDIHQMGNTGARFFVPPFFDPPNPAINPAVHRAQMLVGGLITAELEMNGMKGVVTNSTYDSWWHGGFRASSNMHNMVNMLTEAASVSLASPITQSWSDLTRSTRGLSNAQQQLTNFPDPWPGGEWHLRDIMAYEESTALSILKAAARFKDLIVRNFYEMNLQGIQGKGNMLVPPSKDVDPIQAAKAPYAYVIPIDEQRDPATAAKFLDILAFQSIRVHRAEEAFAADGKSYPAGTYVVLTSQPFRADVLALFGKQVYPDRFEYPGGPPERPYDVAGWTLWMQMGVNVVEVADPFTAKLTQVKEIAAPAGTVASGDASYGYVFGPEMNNAATARIKLMQAGFSLQWVTKAASISGKEFVPGDTIVLAGSGLDAQVTSLAKSLGVSFYPLDSDPGVETKSLSLPKIAIYESWSGNADSGWTRFLMDQVYGIPYTAIYDADVRAGGLGDKFDVILIADMSLKTLLEGRATGTYPSEYTGGIGTEGAANLKAFVEGGGTLVTLNAAGEFATDVADGLGVPVKNVLQGVARSEFYCPGSVLQIQVDNTDPVAFGMAAAADSYNANSPAYEITGPGPIAIASYGADNPLRSGWLLGAEKIENRASAVEAPVGSGKVVMLGFRPQYRGQSYGTFKLLFNSFFYAAAK